MESNVKCFPSKGGECGVLTSKVLPAFGVLAAGREESLWKLNEVFYRRLVFPEDVRLSRISIHETIYPALNLSVMVSSLTG